VRLPFRSLRALVSGGALLLGVAAGTIASAPVAHAQVSDTLRTDRPEDAAADSTHRLRFHPLFTPTSLYSPSRGFGIGGGVQIDGLGVQPDAELRLETRLSQRFQSGQVAYYTGDPYLRSIYGLVAGAVTTTNRLTYYGDGPRTLPEGKLFLDQISAEGEARVGWYPYRSTGLLVQPVARFRFDRLRDFEEGVDSAFTRVDTAALAAVRDHDRYGIAVGIEIAGDTRDRRDSPRHGGLFQGGLSRFMALDGSGLGFNRLEASGYFFFPALVQLPFLPERGTIFLRSSLVITREDEGDALPYYYLPVLDHELLAGFPQRRFVGRDGFSVGVGARGTVLAVLGAVLLEGVGMVMVGGAYDNIFDDFSPRITFDPDPVEEGERVPLRPSVAIGANIVTIDRERPIVGGMIGFGPEGFVLASLRVVFDIRDYRPQIR